MAELEPDTGLRYVNACQSGEWAILTYKKGSGEDPLVRPYRCKSWRHEGPCREHCGACDFARVLQAISEHAHWTYFVLTYPAKKWPNVRDLFRFGVIHWARLRKRIKTEFGDFKYIQTWEVHKSLYPHVNVLISNEDIHHKASVDYMRLRESWFDPVCQEVGFGYCKWAEPLRDRDRMAGYITKLGLELTGAHHKDQTPVNAPPHFRRLRASRGLLPKRAKDDTITGQLFRVSLRAALEQLNGKGDKPDPSSFLPEGVFA